MFLCFAVGPNWQGTDSSQAPFSKRSWEDVKFKSWCWRQLGKACQSDMQVALLHAIRPTWMSLVVTQRRCAARKSKEESACNVLSRA
eukprot:2869309-Amphidinium_carterae.1